MPERSRLSRRQEEKTRSQITRLIVILIALVFVLFFFGAKIIGFVGNIVFNLRGNKNTSQQIVGKDYLEPPFLDPLPQGTPSASITISGNTQYKDGKIEIDVNDRAYKDIDIDSDGKFKKDDVSLSEGNNTIKARVVQNNKASDFSDIQTVTYQKSAPKLDVSTPSDGQQFKNPDQNITVSGKTDPNNTVTVNDHVAVVQDDGSFSYYMQLQNGDNQIKIKATDQAGNTTEKDLKVNYQQ